MTFEFTEDEIANIKAEVAQNGRLDIIKHNELLNRDKTSILFSDGNSRVRPLCQSKISAFFFQVKDVDILAP